MQRVNQYREGGLGKAFSRAEIQFQLAEVDPLLSSIGLFSSLVVEFGYAALFSDPQSDFSLPRLLSPK